MMFPVEVSCPRCGASLMDNQNPVEGFPSIHVVVQYMNRQGNLWLSSLYGSYRGRQEIEIPRGSQVDIVCPSCGELLSDGPPCLACGAFTVMLDMARGGSVRFCSRYGCQKHSIAFGDVGSVVVASIMNRYIVSVYAADSVMTAVETLINYEISGVPVLEEKEKLVGLITEELVLKLAYPDALGGTREKELNLNEPADWEKITCREVAAKDYISISPETSLIDACAIMMKKQRNILLVVKNGVLVGIVSRGDLTRAILREKLG